MVKIAVAPLTGAWIEIAKNTAQSQEFASLPSRERGLKCSKLGLTQVQFAVAPLTGAWIEIGKQPPMRLGYSVAPLTGAWIEICNLCCSFPHIASLPSRERGLKFTGICMHSAVEAGRSPHGSVD